MEPKEIPELPMICGRSINGDPTYYPHAEYRGKLIYFCTDFCRNAFETDRERFYDAHKGDQNET